MIGFSITPAVLAARTAVSMGDKTEVSHMTREETTKRLVRPGGCLTAALSQECETASWVRVS